MHADERALATETSALVAPFGGTFVRRPLRETDSAERTTANRLRKTFVHRPHR